MWYVPTLAYLWYLVLRVRILLMRMSYTKVFLLRVRILIMKLKVASYILRCLHKTASDFG